VETRTSRPAHNTEYLTAGGVQVTRTGVTVDAESEADLLAKLVTSVEARRGGVLSSGMEYPGRYSRWAFGYVDPSVELVARGRSISARALNARGEVLMPIIAAAMRGTGQITVDEPGRIEIFVPQSNEVFTEEERSRQPTVFTTLRAVADLFKPVDDADADPHLGLYGAFGYDLSFQFEPIKLRITRSEDQRDLVLHLADDMLVIDRKRESYTRFSYDFTVGGVSTEGLPRETEPTPGAAAAHPRPLRRGRAERQGEVHPG
jgi:anthranilate synthase